jgi:hypothetical protein
MGMFQPRFSVFVSHAWGDGTGEFIQRLKAHVEQQTLASVWVDTDGLNQQQETLIPAFRDALCQARVVLIVLKPSYLTRPNCLRELRWALDFERAGHLRVVLLSIHPAVTFDGRLQLVQDGSLQGLVFSSKEKKVKRVCPEALALVKRLNDVHMNMLPWHELQAWRSDEKKGDWEEQRQHVQGGTDKTVSLAGAGEGLVEQTANAVKAWLVCAAPRAVSECAAMDDTDVLLATDVMDDDDVCSVLDVTRYPEEAAATLKRETETAMQQKTEVKKKAEEERRKAEAEAKMKAEEERQAEAEAKMKAEEERLKAEAEAKKKAKEERLKAEAEAKKKAEQEAEQRRVAAAAVSARAFRRRCVQALSAVGMCVLLLLLHRAGRLPLRLQRLLAALLPWFRRR